MKKIKQILGRGAQFYTHRQKKRLTLSGKLCRPCNPCCPAKIKEPPAALYNFDVTADNWEDIVDEDSFKAWLEGLSYTDVEITDFKLEDGRLQANLSAKKDGESYLDFSSKAITNVENLTFPDGFIALVLAENQLTSFNYGFAFPDGFTNLYLSNNQITSFDYGFTFPNGFVGLYLDQNQLTSFDYGFAFPDSFEALELSDNQLTSFEYGFAFPEGLTSLNLSNNQITDWSNFEALVSQLPTTTDGAIVTQDNPATAVGTTFKSLAEAKGWTVYA